jgi:membrane fusion protein (multidrug efflux system)
MNAKKKIVIFLTVVALTFVIIIGWRYFVSKKIDEAVALAKSQPTDVIAYKVSENNFYESIETFGTALANQTMTIRIKKNEIEKIINFDQNAFIKKGTLIAKTISEEIIAPFDGRIGKREITPGILGDDESVIASLDAISVLKIDIKLPENYFGILKKGLKVEARSEAFKETFNGKINVISSRVDPTTRSVLVQVLVDNKDFKLVPGMLINAKVIFNERKTLAIPEESLLISGDDKFVYLIKQNSIAKTKVQTGVRNEGKIEITSGISVDDLIIAEGLNKLNPRSKVKIIKTN